MKSLKWIILGFCFIQQVHAQDLNARVQILSPKIQSANKRVLEVLQTTISDFLNGRKWSLDGFKPQERIDCTWIITITDWDGSSPNFKAEAQLLSSRPVYNTAYNSTILNITDKEFDFYYTEGQALEFTEQSYTGNLSSLLAFYANVLVGLDYDSFSKLGGTPYFTKAQNIVSNAQNANYKGWKGFESLRNRYWLSENLSNKSFLPIREGYYTYHRLGLDELAENPTTGRDALLNLLPELQKADQLKQGAMLTQVFFTAKADELVNTLLGANASDKVKAYQLLVQLDPANSSKYEALKK
ncbi:MAG: DUF4835 family protein [Sphingobacteriaceae bacterium]